MSTTVSVIVQPPYMLSDDEGHPLVAGCGVYKIKATDLIQTYINLGLVTIVPESEEPEEAADGTEVVETPVKKTRISAQNQENSDG